MKEYQIYPIKVGMLLNAEKSYFSYGRGCGTKMDLPVIMYLVKGEDTCLLVDTGCSDEEWAKAHHNPILRTPEMEPTNALRALGVEPEDVTVIVNTHLHWDHCFNNDKFPNAKIYVQRKEMQFAISPLPPQFVYYEPHQCGMIPPWIRALDRIVAVDGDYQLADGIDLIFTPGHTPGFQSVLINTAKGAYLIASDTVGLLENWDLLSADGLPHPSGIHIDLSEYYRSLKRMKKICDFVLPGHDPKAFDHSVYPPQK